MEITIHGYDPDAYGGGHLRETFSVLVNGRPARRLRDGTGCRSIFIDEEVGVVVKVEHRDDWPGGDTLQAQSERDLWELLDESDREYFGEILDAQVDNDGLSWVVQRYYPDMKDASTAPEIVKELANLLASKYDLGEDWYPRQWKVVDGKPLIHDFGISGLTSGY